MAGAEETIQHLLSLESVRKRTALLLQHPDLLQNFDLDLDKLQDCTTLVLDLIKRDYKELKDIPPHSRWRHFEASIKPAPKKDRITPLVNDWKSKGVDQLEITRRLLDLFVPSVLLDAGAGDKWVYVPPSKPNCTYNRSEGLGIASLDLFTAGCLSSDASMPFQADAHGLKNLTVDTLAKVFQVSDSNPLVGLEGRCSLLTRLGQVLIDHPKYFGKSNPRPGNLLDFLLAHPTTKKSNDAYHVDINTLWEVVIKGFSGVWPAARTKFNGVSLGDVWPCKAFEEISKLPDYPLKEYHGAENFVCFHKLSQWLTYSLMEPLMLCNIVFSGVENMTGLAEYRNGGLFVDMGVLKLKPVVLERISVGKLPTFEVYDDVVVEWRALTVGLLDKVATQVREKLHLSETELPLAKVLEAGTWKAGREIAAKLRPETKGPPIQIISDGTVF